MAFKPYKTPQPKKKADGSYYSGPSIPKGKILKQAAKLAKKEGIKLAIAEKIIRRTIAKIKCKKYHLPCGVIIWPYHYVGTYSVKFKRVKVKCGPVNITKHRAVDCDCPSSSRCWHMDFTDYLMDGFNVRPQKYGGMPMSFVKRMLEKGK